jgi:hypothetical protein
VVTHRWLVALAVVLIGVALLAARPHSTPGPFLRDFEAYWAAGQAWNAGHDPYGPAIWRAERIVPGVDTRHDEALPFVGPPATLLGWGLLARLPYSLAAAIWAVFLGASGLILVVATLRGSGAPLAPLTFLGSLALAFAFGSLTSDLALGQLALPAFLGATLVSRLGPRSFAAATAGACLAYVQPNASLGIVSQFGRNRTTLAFAVAAPLITYLLGVLAVGWAWPASYARVLSMHESAETLSAIQFTPASIAHAFGASPVVAEIMGFLFIAATIGAAIFLSIKIRDGFARFAALSALAPFVADFFHEHDFVVVYAAVVWCALRTSGIARAVALAGVLLVSVDWLGLAQRPTGIAQSALLAAAALAAFGALGERRDTLHALAVAAPFAALFIAATRLATLHPAPIWPDALGPFTAPAAASIATVWQAEQRASGLLAAVPAWGVLRSLSLLGCAVLAYAIYRHSSYCRTA